MDTEFGEEIEHTRLEVESLFILKLAWIVYTYPNTTTRTLKLSGLN